MHQAKKRPRVARGSASVMIDIETIKSLHPLSSVVGQVTQLRRRGSQWEGRCPLHDDTRPSFYVDDQKGVYYCHGCNASGDVIQFAMAYNRVSFSDAVVLLQSGSSFGNLPPPRVPKVTQRWDSGNAARSIWRSALPIEGTPATKYLRNRGLDVAKLPPLPALRFGRLSYRGGSERVPALIAGISSPAGDIVGVQRIFLTEDGQKLDVPTPKMSLGPRPGGAIRLGEGETELIVCEGIEDGLSILMDMPDRAVWVTAGANMMRSIWLPATCHTVVIARDNDKAGLRASDEAKNAFLAAGKTVHVMTPASGCKDFNEMISRGTL